MYIQYGELDSKRRDMRGSLTIKYVGSRGGKAAERFRQVYMGTNASAMLCANVRNSWPPAPRELSGLQHLVTNKKFL